jgi:hypothetical protein
MSTQRDLATELILAIKNGTPLPTAEKAEGMPENRRPGAARFMKLDKPLKIIS